MIIRKTVDLQAIAEELGVYESKFALPSARLVDAFRDADGSLDETPVFHRWQSLYTVWLRITGDPRRTLV